MKDEEIAYHVPVLGDEILRLLEPRHGDTVLDCTVGGGGHSALLLSRVGEEGRVVALDRDAEAVEWVRKRFFGDARFTVCKSRFGELEKRVGELGVKRITGALFDLGVSSHQFDTPGRGFSYRFDAPLDMRMDQENQRPLAVLLREESESTITQVLQRFGDVSKAHRLAARIKQRAVATTGELKSAVCEVLGDRPAAFSKVFMAFRIWVNREMEELGEALDQAFRLLAPSGVLAVISYHSGEDRLVKQWMRPFTAACRCPQDSPVCRCGGVALAENLTRHAWIPKPEEITANPRARSARLRGIRKR